MDYGDTMKRRDALSKGGMTALAWAIGCHNKEPTISKVNNTPTTRCMPTSSDMEGPFYPPALPTRSQLYQNIGQRIILSGTIKNRDCVPLNSGFIHLWHANHKGDYDLNDSERDYTGQQAILDGKYQFETLLPGAYANGPKRYRPRHFHFKIKQDNRVLLTTQLYFAEDEYLKFEPHLPDERKVHLELNARGDLVGRFDFIVSV